MSSPFRSTGDLLMVVVWTSFTVAAIVTGLAPGALRAVLALPLVLLFPGYTLLAALFPEKQGTGDEERGASITNVERFALSVVVSLALVPMLAFVVNYTNYGLRLLPLLVAVAGVTILLAVIAYLVRIRLPVERRFGDYTVGWLASGTGRFFSTARRARDSRPLQPTTGTQSMLNVVFAVSVLALLATAGYAAVTPPANDDPFTEFYLTTQTGDGQYVTEELPKQYTAGESQSLFVVIGNQEGQRVPYTVVVQLDGNELDRFSTSVGEGHTKRIQQQVTPSQTGDRLKLSFLLYRGNVPENPTPENAYRETHLWISVSG